MIQIYPTEDRMPCPPRDAFGNLPRPAHPRITYFTNQHCKICGKVDEIYDWGKWGWFASCEHLAPRQEVEAATLA